VVGTGAAFGAEADTAGQNSKKIEDRGGQSGSITCAVLAICSTRSDAIQKKSEPTLLSSTENCRTSSPRESDHAIRA
jgi:hypothetical protein